MEKVNNKSFFFKKDEELRWYVDLPEYIEQGGKKEDLEMILGADLLLDILAENENEVEVKFNTSFFKESKYELTLDRSEEEGSYYKLTGQNLEFEVYLCPVTVFVFGSYPEKIYLR